MDEAAAADRTHAIPLPVKVGYAGALFGVALVQIGVSTLLLYFYTDIMRFSPASAGVLMFVGGLTDCVANLLAAAAATYDWSRFGRYRPFLLYGAAPLGATFALLFIKPDLSAGLLFAVALVVHVLYRASYAFIAVPHASLITRMSADADERASIGGVKAIAGGLGTLGAGYLGLSIIAWLGGADERAGFVWFGVIIGVVTAISVFVSGAVTREVVTTDGAARESAALWPAVRLAARNRALMAVLIANVLFFITYAFLFGGVAYFFKYLAADPGHTKTAILALGIGAVLFPSLWVALARRRGKAFTWVVGTGLMALLFVALHAVTAPPLWLLLTIYLLLGAGKASVLMNYYAMTADAVDYGAWTQGKRLEAYSFGFLSLSSKLGLALGGGAMGLALGWAGFEANVAQDSETLARMRVALCLIPAAVVAASAFAIRWFGVSTALHRRIVAELAVREA